MDSLSKNINALEREMQISQINPIKIIGGASVVLLICVIGYIYWVKPTALFEPDQSISWPKMIQFMIGIAVALLSILWILWNLFMY